MIDLDSIPQSYQQAVDLLAQWHRENGTVIYSADDPNQAVVRLIEASKKNPDVTAIRPFHFGRSTAFPFESQVVLISRSDEQKMLQGQLTLPTGWNLSQLRRL